MAVNDLDRILKNLELENEQYVKLIEKENQQIEAIEKETEYEKERCIRYQESTSQLDEDLKRHHKQFTYLRDNCDSLKKTRVILKEHEEALVKKLDEVVIKNEQERMEHGMILSQYQNKWKEYHEVYESFPLVQTLRKHQAELAVTEQQVMDMQAQIKDLEGRIRDKQAKKELSKPPFESTEAFIIKIAEIKLEVMQTERETGQLVQQKKETEKNIKNVKQQLNDLEQDRLMRLASADLEQKKIEEAAHTVDQEMERPGQDRTVYITPSSPVILPQEPMRSTMSGPSQEPTVLIKSPPKITLPTKAMEGHTEVPLLRQLHQSNLKQRILSSANPPPTGTPPTPPTIPAPVIPRLSIPQLIPPSPRPTPIPPLQMVRTPKISIPQKPRTALPLDMIGTPGQSKDIPANVDAPATPTPRPADFPRVNLPMEMIGKLPQKNPPMTPVVSVPTLPPMTPTKSFVLTVPMSPHVPRHVSTPRPLIMPSTPRVSIPDVSKLMKTPSVPVPMETNETYKTPDRSSHAVSTPNTPKTPEGGATNPADDSPFNIDKHLKHLSDLKCKSPGFMFDSRPMCPRSQEQQQVETSRPTETPMFSVASFFGFGGNNQNMDQPQAPPTTTSAQDTMPSPTPTATQAANATSAFNFSFNTDSNDGFGYREQNSTQFNFGGGDDTSQESTNFSFGGFGGGGDSGKGNVLSMFGGASAKSPKSPDDFNFAGFGGGAEQAPESPQTGFSFAGFGDAGKSPTFNSGNAFNMFSS